MTSRRAFPALLLPLVAGLSGCAADEARPGPRDNDLSPPASPAATPGAPAKDPESEGGSVVIKGSRSRPAPTSPARPAPANPNQAKIDELRRRAKDSEGRNEGGPIASTPTSSGTAYDPQQERLADLENERTQLLKEREGLLKERASLMTETRVRQGNRAVGTEVSTNPERTGAIEARVNEIQKRIYVIEPEIKELRGSAGTGTYGPGNPSQVKLGPQGPGTTPGGASSVAPGGSAPTTPPTTPGASPTTPGALPPGTGPDAPPTRQ